MIAGKTPPVWLMGLTNALFGMYGGILGVDGWGYSHAGVSASYVVEAALSLAASGVLAAILFLMSRRSRTAGLEPA